MMSSRVGQISSTNGEMTDESRSNNPNNGYQAPNHLQNHNHTPQERNYPISLYHQVPLRSRNQYLSTNQH